VVGLESKFSRVWSWCSENSNAKFVVTNPLANPVVFWPFLIPPHLALWTCFITPLPPHWCYKSCWYLHAITNHLVARCTVLTPAVLSVQILHTTVPPARSVSRPPSVSSAALYSSALHNTNHFILIIRRGAFPHRTVQTRVLPHSCAGKYSEPRIYIIFRWAAKCVTLLYHFEGLITFPLEDGGNGFGRNDGLNCVLNCACHIPPDLNFNFHCLYFTWIGISKNEKQTRCHFWNVPSPLCV